MTTKTTNSRYHSPFPCCSFTVANPKNSSVRGKCFSPQTLAHSHNPTTVEDSGLVLENEVEGTDGTIYPNSEGLWMSRDSYLQGKHSNPEDGYDNEFATGKLSFADEDGDCTIDYESQTLQISPAVGHTTEPSMECIATTGLPPSTYKVLRPVETTRETMRARGTRSQVPPPGIRITGIAPEFAESLRQLLVLDSLVAPPAAQRSFIPEVPWSPPGEESPRRSRIPVSHASMQRLRLLASSRTGNPTSDECHQRHRDRQSRGYGAPESRWFESDSHAVAMQYGAEQCDDLEAVNGELIVSCNVDSLDGQDRS
jgi:hypothetical protein